MSETEPKIIPWWERDEELQAIAKKCDALFTYAGHTRPMCHCQDEGAIEEVYHVCPAHPPKSLTHMRAIVKHVQREAYERGIGDSLSKMREKMKEVWEERDK